MLGPCRGPCTSFATPLGNLDDLSDRARRVLASVARIACEDTRRTARLLARFGLETPTVSCHRFNERERLEPVLAALRAGDDVALVSDGGTPGISDPGALLVAAAHDAGLPVVPIPGPCAAVALLSAGGLPADRFVMEGFLPHRAGERRRRLRELRGETRPIVIHEAPHRILGTLADIGDVLGPRRLVLGRELTKLHEEILRGTPDVLSRALGDAPRGEITLIVAPGDGDAAPDEARSTAVLDAWRRALAGADGDRRAALRAAARELDMKRPELRRLLDELGE